MKIDFENKIPVGYAVYDYDMCALKYCVCLWCFYPIFIISIIIVKNKFRFYKWLNKKGIMHTPEFCPMTFSDLFKKSEKPFTYKNIIAGYFKYEHTNPNGIFCHSFTEDSFKKYENK
jgi:hypothetical protein